MECVQGEECGKKEMQLTQLQAIYINLIII